MKTIPPIEIAPAVFLPAVNVVRDLDGNRVETVARSPIQRTRQHTPVTCTMEAVFNHGCRRLELTEINEKGRRGRTSIYGVREIGCEWVGRAWHLECREGTSDPEESGYSVFLGEAPTSRCECKHAASERGGGCKHTVSLRALLEAGAFDADRGEDEIPI